MGLIGFKGLHKYGQLRVGLRALRVSWFRLQKPQPHPA